MVFPMLFYRYSKSLWLCLDYLFSPVEESSVEMRTPRINPDEASPAVEVEDVRHVYGEREALGGVSFSVARGEMFALLGPNGGGKATLFKISQRSYRQPQVLYACGALTSAANPCWFASAWGWFSSIRASTASSRYLRTCGTTDTSTDWREATYGAGCRRC